MKVYFDTNGFYTGPGVWKPGVNQNVTVGAASAATAAAFGTTTKVVRVLSSTAAYIAFAATPTADTTGILVPANLETFIQLPGVSLKLAAIQVAAGGVMSVTECL